MDINKLKKKIIKGHCDVEDILMLAKYPSNSTASELQNLAVENKWKRGVSAPEIPFGDWAEVVVEYCFNGMPGLEAMAARYDRINFVLSLLSQIGTELALNTTEAILLNNLDRFMENETEGSKLAATLNSIAFSQKARLFNSSNINEVRSFFHKYLENPRPDNIVGTIFCALRFYGDETSLDVINRQPEMPPHWEVTRKSALSFIKKRN